MNESMTDSVNPVKSDRLVWTTVELPLHDDLWERIIYLI
jgi:hypothetical protein